MLWNMLTFFLFGGEYYAKRIGVTVGMGCRIYTRHFGSEPYLITIGDNVTLTQTVRFVTHDGAAWIVRDSEGRRHCYRRIVIGSNVFVGLNAIILPGVTIGDNCIVAAGSVVTRAVPAGSVIAGVPAKVIGTFEKYAERARSTYISESEIVRRGGLCRATIEAISDS